MSTSTCPQHTITYSKPLQPSMTPPDYWITFTHIPPNCEDVELAFTFTFTFTFTASFGAACVCGGSVSLVFITVHLAHALLALPGRFTLRDTCYSAQEGPTRVRGVRHDAAPRTGKAPTSLLHGVSRSLARDYNISPERYNSSV